MTSVGFAFVVATVLFLVFDRTRWMGVVGLFVLLSINPWLFGSLLLVAAVAAGIFHLRRHRFVL